MKINSGNNKKAKSYIFLIVLLLLVSNKAIAQFVETTNSKTVEKINLTKEERAWLDKHKNIRLGMSSDHTPFLIENEDGSHKGISVDYFEIVNKRLGINIQLHVEDSWVSVQETAKDLEIDGLAFSGISKTRKEHFGATDVIFDTYNQVYARTEDRFRPKSMKDLEGLKVGYKEGAKVTQQILEMYPGLIPIQLENNNEALLKALLEKDIDVFVAWISFDHWLDNSVIQKGDRKIQGMEKVMMITEHPISIATLIRKDWPELIPILNKAIQSIKQDGLNKIINEWFYYESLSTHINLTDAENAWLDKNHTVQVPIIDIPPYMIINKDGALSGISIDYLELISERCGVKFDYQLSETTTVQLLNSIDNIDLIPTIVATPDRQQFLNFTKEYIKSPYMIFTHSDNKQIILGIKDVLDYKVAITEGTVLHEMIKRDYPELKLLLYPDSKKAVEAVASKEADAYIGNMTIASWLILNRGLFDLKIVASTPFNDQLFSMGIRNDWPELASIINKGLATITEFEQAEIRNKYISLRYEDITRHEIIKWVLIVIALASGIIFIFVFWNKNLRKQVLKRTLNLAKSEEKFRQLMEQSSIGTIINNLDGSVQSYNTTWAKLWNLNKKQQEGIEQRYNTLKDEQLSEHSEEIKRLFAGEPMEPFIIEYDPIKELDALGIEKNKHEIKFIRISGYPLKDKGGKLIQIVLFNEDITENKKAEDKLKESEERFRQLMEQSSTATIIYNLDGSIQSFNPTWVKLWNLNKTQLEVVIQKNNILKDEQLSEYSEKIKRLFAGELIKPFVVEYDPGKALDALGIEKNENEKRFIQLTGYPLKDKGGKLIHIVIFNEDITENKKAEDKLKESEERYRQLIEQSSTAIIIHNLDGSVQSVNPTWVKLWDLNKKQVEEVIQKFNILKDEQLSEFSEKIERLFAGELMESFIFEYDPVIELDVLGIDNTKPEKRSIRISGYPLKDKGGKLIQIVIFNEDITENKKAEEKIKESEQKFSTTFENQPIPVSILNLVTGERIALNNSFCETFAYSKSRLLSENFIVDGSVIIKEELHIAMNKLLNDGYLSSYPVSISNGNGGINDVLINASRLYPNNNEIFIISYLDITEQKSTQKKLAKNEKQLYQSIVNSEEKERARYAKELHDGLGPILSTSMIYLHTLLEEHDRERQKEQINRTMELLEDAVKSVKEITNNLSPNILMRYGLVQAVKSFIEKLSHISDIKFSINSNLENRFSEVVEITLFRSLIELINNSIKYANASKIAIKINYLEGRLSVLFSDNGKGFDYNKVKEEGKGFGLLNIENRIKKINGIYNYKTVRDEGVEVEISIKTNHS